MKRTIGGLLVAAMLIAASHQIHAQGLVYDQQSATGPVSVAGNGNADGLNLQEDQPLVQSFIPSLSTIGFVSLEFADIPNNGTNGATVYVKLWTGSPMVNLPLATFLGSTTPVYMPNGFMNNGLGIAGITTFNFSTLIALIPGQTYYFQPLVLSGDDPWDIIAIGNTYANGQIFEDGDGFNSDFWFQEGTVSVPEPSTLALVGVISSLCFFGFKRRSKLPVLFLAGVLFIVPVLPVYSTPDSVVQATAAEAELTPINATTLSEGTFWVMTVSPDGDFIESPYPFLPSDLSDLPTYSVTNDIYMVDDTSGELAPASAGRMSNAQATSIAQSQAATIAALIQQIQFPTDEGDQPDGGFTPMVFTNGLWLEIINKNPTNFWLRLHGTVGGDNYQLLSITNLSNTNWNLGQILFYASDGYADFSAVLMTNAPTFFRAHHANPVMAIVDNQDSEELNPTNTGNPGYSGSLYIYNEGSATNDMTVYYSISGTAQNGVDYSNLTGAVTVPVSQGYAEIDIDPTADGLKPNQTIILTLTQNTNYLIDPAYDSATNTLYSNPQVYPLVQGDQQFPCPNTSLTFDLASYVNDPRGLPLSFTIQTWPVHGTLFTNTSSTVTYTSTNCYEGQDSFTYIASDGQYASTGTVTLVISDAVYATPVSEQTCRGTPVSFRVGSDICGEALGFALLSNPAHGTLSGTAANLTYTPTNSAFTGTDSFNYIVYDGCGVSFATNAITVTVGDFSLSPNAQRVVTGTNQPVAITLNGVDTGDNCKDNTNYYIFTITSSPTNGILTGTPPNITYTPNTNYEGLDSFQFNVSDGVWTSSTPATVTLFVAAGPVLTAGSLTCNPFGTAVQLNWSLDTVVSNFLQLDGLDIIDFIVYRSTNSAGPYTAIAKNYFSTNWTSYLDSSAVSGQTNYYAVTFQTFESGVTNASPPSNVAAAMGFFPTNLIQANAFWDSVTNYPYQTNVIRLQAPFSSYGTNQYPGIYPLPNSYWPIGTTCSNHIALYIPTNSLNLSLVQYSIAIDNNYKLYLNNSNAPIDTFNHEGPPVWSSFKTFNSVATNLLHFGTNDIRVVTVDEGGVNYFSMVVTTNTCGQ